MTFRIGKETAIGLKSQLDTTINHESLSQSSALSSSICSTNSDESITFGVRSHFKKTKGYLFRLNASFVPNLQASSLALPKLLSPEREVEFDILKKCFIIYRNTHSNDKVRDYALKSGYSFSFFQDYFKAIEAFNADIGKMSENEAWAKAVGSQSIDPIKSGDPQVKSVKTVINPLYLPTLIEILEPALTFKV